MSPYNNYWQTQHCSVWLGESAILTSGAIDLLINASCCWSLFFSLGSNILSPCAKHVWLSCQPQTNSLSYFKSWLFVQSQMAWSGLFEICQALWFKIYSLVIPDFIQCTVFKYYALFNYCIISLYRKHLCQVYLCRVYFWNVPQFHCSKTATSSIPELLVKFYDSLDFIHSF